jgi:putative transposase
MSQTARLAMVSQPHRNFSIVEQCALRRVPLSTLYYKPKPVSDDDLTLMRRIDEIYMKWPFYGSRGISTSTMPITSGA